MLRTALGSRVRKIDETAIKERGIPGEGLMETAGSKLYRSVLKSLKEIDGSRCVIVCGAGNNGGDGYVAARLLKECGIKESVFSLVDTKKLSGDALLNFERYTAMGGETKILNSDKNMNDFILSSEAADVIVDAVFGTGISREIGGNAKRVIDIINSSGKYVVSVDIPSGIGADDGRIYGVSVKADKTVTFQMNKLGMCIEPGRTMAGKVEVEDIGLPEDLCREEKGIVYIMEEKDAAKLLPKRNVLMNKGDAGKVLIAAGSRGMAGAAVLAARAAYRSGAGLVKVAAVWDVVQIIQAAVPEATCLILDEDVNNNIKLISKEAEAYDAVAVGPGLGRSENAVRLVEHIIRNISKPLLLDADAINIVSENPDMLREHRGRVVMTPHPGEMGRLIGCSAKEVNENRVRIAQSFASEYNVTLVLKGSGSVIACPDGTVYVNPTGSPSMATAGSGDVLSGITGAFLAAGLSDRDSILLGTYVHGLSGELCSREYGEYGTTASDIAEFAGIALKKLTMTE
ncbi:MAG: NAD(P)H-hydrate dehydratase [Bacillota bacterium]|nr:NAD(P)H-hydrate dehydratase [Bacillota bacterium]